MVIFPTAAPTLVLLMPKGECRFGAPYYSRLDYYYRPTSWYDYLLQLRRTTGVTADAHTHPYIASTHVLAR